MEKFKQLMKSRTFWLVVLIIMFLIVVAIYIRKRNREKKEEEARLQIRREALKDKVTEKEKELSVYLRKLFSEHALWTKNYMTAFMTNAKNLDDTAARTLKNQDQIGRALGMWYGNDDGKKIGNLFRQHISEFELMLKEMVERNKNGSIVAEKRWHDTTNKLVNFLNSVNPKFNITELGQNFTKYNEQMTSMATAKARNKHAEEIAAFDKLNNQAATIADMLTNGIVRQFPSQFDKSEEITEFIEGTPKTE